MSKTKTPTAQPQRTLRWDLCPADSALVDQIVERAAAIYHRDGYKLDRLQTTMDLTAAHLNGCPLDLAKLLASSPFNLSHDINGLAAHLNRSTGEIDGCFLPRCARPTVTSTKG